MNFGGTQTLSIAIAIFLPCNSTQGVNFENCIEYVDTYKHTYMMCTGTEIFWC